MEPNYQGIPSGVVSKKRPFKSNCTDEPNPKRPALSSVMAEALKIDAIQMFVSVIEPVFRRIVREEMEIFIAKQEQNRTPERYFHLRIASNLPKLFYAGEKVGGIHVSLIDSRTGEPTCLQSPLTLLVVVLQGDFHKGESENWTEAEFNSAVVRGRHHNLVVGSLKVTMKEGVAEFGGISFTDNSSWVKSKKFRFGIKVVSGCRVRVREGVSEAFTVLAQRGEAYMKHHPPQPMDEVWRLEKIRKDGIFHTRLTAAGIHNVAQFVNFAAADEEGMKRILGSTMCGKTWKTLYEHANTCVCTQSGQGVYDLQQGPSYLGAEKCSQYLAMAATPQSVDMDHLLASVEVLQEEDLRDDTEFLDDCLFLNSEGGEGCSNKYELPHFESASRDQYFGENWPSFSSKTAVIGWLKVKAVMRWGIFVRNEAVKRRARLSEMQD